MATLKNGILYHTEKKWGRCLLLDMKNCQDTLLGEIRKYTV